MSGFPIVIVPEGGFPVRAVTSRAPVMMVAPNEIGVPVVVSNRGAPFIVQGVIVPAGGFVFGVRTRDGVPQYAVSPARKDQYATQGAD